MVVVGETPTRRAGGPPQVTAPIRAFYRGFVISRVGKAAHTRLVTVENAQQPSSVPVVSSAGPYVSLCAFQGTALKAALGFTFYLGVQGTKKRGRWCPCRTWAFVPGATEPQQGSQQKPPLAANQESGHPRVAGVEGNTEGDEINFPALEPGFSS